MKHLLSTRGLMLAAMVITAALFAAGVIGPDVAQGVATVGALGMINYVGPGDKLVVVAPYAANAGAGMQVGNNLFGIAVDTLTSGATGVMATEGVFDITKTTTAALAIGDKAYWDNTNKRLTATSTSNLPVGVVLETAATTATTARVKLAECPIVAAGS